MEAIADSDPSSRDFFVEDCHIKTGVGWHFSFKNTFARIDVERCRGDIANLGVGHCFQR